MLKRELALDLSRPSEMIHLNEGVSGRGGPSWLEKYSFNLAS